jgi:ZIP family zinc transporter
MMPLLFAAAAFASTMIGGLCALRYRERLPLFMGFAAGVILGVVSFEVFPEIIAQVGAGAADPTQVMTAFAGGFLLFHFLEKLLPLHHSHGEDCARSRHPHLGMLAAAVLAGHSFLDGVGIALGFKISPAVGVAVAIAVVAHDFTDGMNTVALMLSHENTPSRAKLFLWIGALAPAAGIAAVQSIAVPPRFLTLYLGFLAGFLLYIAAADILPEAHSRGNSSITAGMTGLGTLFSFLISRVV